MTLYTLEILFDDNGGLPLWVRYPLIFKSMAEAELKRAEQGSRKTRIVPIEMKS